MIQINKNITALKESATLKINQEVKQLRNIGKEVFHFGFGQSPFPIHQSIVKALTDNATYNHYLPTNGLPALKNSISLFLSKHQNITYDADSIFIGPGSKEFLYQIILLLEGVFLIPQASWLSYLPQILSKGAKHQIIPTAFKNNYKLEAQSLKKYCEIHKQVQKTLILNSPNNPTGAVYNDDELKAIADVCKAYQVIVLSDEIYSQINFTNNCAPSIAKYYPENTLVFGGLSKVFSAGGYRLGFVAIPKSLDELYNPLQALISETFSSVSAPIQYAAVKAFNFDKDVKNYVTDSTVILKGIAKYIYDKLTENNIICTKPQGAFYMLIDFENYRKALSNLKINNASDLTTYLLANHNIALLPGSDFYFNEETLTCRLATVDFDGEKVYCAFKMSPIIDAEFIKQHTPNIYKGLIVLNTFLNHLK